MADYVHLALTFCLKIKKKMISGMVCVQFSFHILSSVSLFKIYLKFYFCRFDSDCRCQCEVCSDVETCDVGVLWHHSFTLM